MHDLLPLAALRAGQEATIADVLGESALVDRLGELGLHRGAVVEMLQPGSPCIIRLAGHRLCLRADELDGVLVRTGVTL